MFYFETLVFQLKETHRGLHIMVEHRAYMFLNERMRFC